MATHGIGHWYIEIQKEAYWRGSRHTWVNRYVMSGSDPSASDANTVIGILKGIENQLHPLYAAAKGVGFVEARAYKSTGGTPFTTVVYNATGAPAQSTGFAGGSWTPLNQTWASTLEVCTLIETPLNGLNSRGKPIYLRKYIRGCGFPVEDNQSGAIPAPDVTGIQAAVAPWTTGMGANNWVVIGTSGLQASGPAKCHPYMVNHQVPRGRKKKVASTSDSVLGQLLNGVAAAGGAVQLGEAIGGAL